MKIGRFYNPRLPHSPAAAGMAAALWLLWVPQHVTAATPVFGEFTGRGGRGVLEDYRQVFGGRLLAFDEVVEAALLDTEFSDSHGVTFWTTTTRTGTHLATPHNLAGTRGVSGVAQGAIGGSPFPAAGYDSRPSYEIRFNHPQRWAGLDREFSSWSSRCLTRFYAHDGSLLAELDGYPERFVGYVCEDDDPDTWISRIECTGELRDGIPQVGPSDDLIFGRDLDTQGPDIILYGDNPLFLALGTPYTEPGFSAVDYYQGDMTASVDVTGTVNAYVSGTYTLRYRVVDAWSNPSEAIRTVQVVGELPGQVQPPGTPSGYVDATKRPTFSWEQVAEAEWYSLAIRRNGTVYHRTWVKETSWTPDWNMEAGEYSWTVATWNLFGLGAESVPKAFEIAYMLPETTTLLAPDGLVTNNRPTFVWTDEEFAAWAHIIIQRFGKTVVDEWVEDAVTFTPAHADRLQYGHYRWWIREWGLDGLGAWSGPLEFGYGFVTPLGPDGQNIPGRRPVLEWTPLTDAAWYNIAMRRNDEAFATEWTQVAGAWEPAEDLPPGSYRWWIRAWNERGIGPWSDESTFGIGAVSPLRPAGDLDAMPTLLSWNDSGCPEATWYRIQIDHDGETAADFWVPRADTRSDSVNRIVDWPQDLVLAPGAACTWRIRTWQPTGSGPWSGEQAFTMP